MVRTFEEAADLLASKMDRIAGGVSQVGDYWVQWDDAGFDFSKGTDHHASVFVKDDILVGIVVPGGDWTNWSLRADEIIQTIEGDAEDDPTITVEYNQHGPVIVRVDLAFGRNNFVVYLQQPELGRRYARGLGLFLKENDFPALLRPGETLPVLGFTLPATFDFAAKSEEILRLSELEEFLGLVS